MIFKNMTINKNRFKRDKFFLKALRGQSVIEYSVIIAIIVGALLGMRIYMTRSVEGYLRGSVDEEQQFVPSDTTYKYTTTQVNPIVSTETYGLADDGTTFDQGVYKYTLNTPSQVNRSATGADAEQYSTLLSTACLYID